VNVRLLRRRARPWVLALLGLVLAAFVLDRLFPPPPPPPYSTLVTAADGSILHAFLSPDDKWRLRTEAADVPPALVRALLFKEDRWFRYHPGVNPLALVRAAFFNLLTGRRTSGASTITMQVVRLLEPRPRTYPNKARELLRALQLEAHYSKDDILRLYLSLVPYGSNIEGLGSAALLYFQKSPRVLSLAELTTLVVVPNRPSSLRLGRANAAVVRARNTWLRRFGAAGLFEKTVIADALREPLTATRHAAPQRAPHLAHRLKAAYPHEARLVTTLRPAAQTTAERLALRYVRQLRSLNIRNAAVLVVDTRTRAVEAYVGSADFHDATDGGQVDGVRAVRSPGSTLKPLLYATAFDAGLITPKTALYDVPTQFSGYQPGNFDERFRGKVTVDYALAHSLNVPAVRVLHELGTAALLAPLRQAQFATIRRQAPGLGLSMVLGGCGATLEELTGLYAAFADTGRFAPLRYLAGASPTGAGEPLVSAGAAFLVTQTLTQLTRPDLPDHYEYTFRVPRIAWKTGTSFGKKDAWSIGYNGRYTIGVWVGNFSGEGVPELNGAHIATPLLFQLFNALDYQSAARWFGVPAQLALRKVCAVSGAIPGEGCTHLVPDYYLPGTSRMTRCAHLREVWVSAAETQSYCAYCLPPTGAVRRRYPHHPPELAAWYETEQIAYEKIPPHNPRCTALPTGTPPRITFPIAGNQYRLSSTERTRLALTCQVSPGVNQVHWYLNDQLIGSAAPTASVFCDPPAGEVRISCRDDQGRTTHVRIHVRRY
jgi:penicillin-binding protein 1C